MIKYKIAIIVDNQKYAKKIVEYLEKYIIECALIYEDVLKFIYCNSFYDIVFVSSELAKKNCLLQRRGKKDKLYILISTSSMVEELDNSVFRFIVKENFKIEINEAIYAAFEYLSHTFISIYVEKKNCCINLKEVLVVYSENHYLNFVMNNKTLRCRKGLKEIIEYLEFNDFIRSKSGCYVNVHHLVRYDRRTIILDNNTHVDVSRYGYKELVKKITTDNC